MDHPPTGVNRGHASRGGRIGTSRVPLDPCSARARVGKIVLVRSADHVAAVGRGSIGPWFRERPRLAIAVASTLTLVCSVIGAVQPDDRALALALFALPVSLMAVTFGRTGGIAAGVVGVALAGLWSLQTFGAEVGGTGGVTAGMLVLLGGLLGQAEDGLDASNHRVRQGEGERAHLEEKLRRQAEAVAINDLMLQSVAVAKWALEAGNAARALEVLEEIGQAGQDLVSSLLRDTDPLPADRSGLDLQVRRVDQGSQGHRGPQGPAPHIDLVEAGREVVGIHGVAVATPDVGEADAGPQRVRPGR
jgi:hypothetical protein